MENYILFANTLFNDFKNTETYFNSSLNKIDTITNIKILIENENNVIILFDTNDSMEVLSNKIVANLSDNNVKYHFLFKKDSLLYTFIPKELKDIIYNDVYGIFELKFTKKQVEKQKYDLDIILEKIKIYGLENLTIDEKEFLDNFEK